MIDDLNKRLSKEEEEFKNFLFEKVFASQITESPFKTKGQSVQETKLKAQQSLDALKQDIARGMTLFQEKALPSERDQLNKIFAKMNATPISLDQKLVQNPLEMENLEFLEEIARRTLADGQYEEGSAMFRLLIQLNLTYGSAWVGWAIAEEAQEHLEITKQIYDIATALLPENYFILLFAAEFYMNNNEQIKAKELLLKGKERLSAEGQENSASYREIKDLLNLF